MTTKERLHQLIDELSEVEAADALQVIAERRVSALEIHDQSSIVLGAEQAQRFLDALANPESFKERLQRLVERPRVLGE